jgi:hypothetical protein
MDDMLNPFGFFWLWIGNEPYSTTSRFHECAPFLRRLFSTVFYGGKNILKRADHGTSQHAEDCSSDDPIGNAHV